MNKHGFSIGIERFSSQIYIAMKAYGRLTHADYEQMTPLLSAALNGIPEHSVDVLLDVTELEGWELRAAWDDFQLGLKHGSEFRKIAMLGNRDWQAWATKVAAWFISGEAQYFEDRAEAISWLEDK
ncbi:STAS/SEC14 domain-containing protein [Simiduia litorea]|uniref:STAS/SEC14 domain-containing protein n=1 Tax=Simiduia litorea TaxID=1435348 RepID=UPI0036F290D4